MNLNKTQYIVEELVEAGLVSQDNFDKVTAIIDNGAKFNKKYQTEKTIYDYLNQYSSSFVNQADVDAVYSLINSKYKEDAKLTKDEIELQVIQYLKENKKYTPKVTKDNLNNWIQKTEMTFPPLGHIKFYSLF